MAINKRLYKDKKGKDKKGKNKKGKNKKGKNKKGKNKKGKNKEIGTNDGRFFRKTFDPQRFHRMWEQMLLEFPDIKELEDMAHFLPPFDLSLIDLLPPLDLSLIDLLPPLDLSLIDLLPPVDNE